MTRIGFDLDNTLYYRTKRMQRKIRARIHRLAAERLGLSVAEARRRFEANYRKVRSGSRSLMAMGMSRPEAKAIARRAMDTAEIARYIRPDPRLRKRLEALRERIDLDLVTGSPEYLAKEKLAALRIPLTLFCHRFYGEVDRSKSDGSTFRVWTRAARCPPGECVYVGDDEVADYEVPRRLGMRAILIERGKEARRTRGGWIVPSVYRACDLLMEVLK